MFFRSKKGQIQILKEHSSNRDALSVIEEWEKQVPVYNIKTSGSTGKPKKIKLTREQLLASIQSSSAYFNWSNQDLFICNLNTESIAGKMMLSRATELKAAILYIPPNSNPLEALLSQERLIEPYKCRLVLALVPLQLEQALASIKTRSILNYAKTILVGGASVSSKLKIKIANLTAPTFATYGMTETVTHIAVQQLSASNNADSFHTLPGVSITSDKRSCLQVKAPQTDHKWITTNDLVEIINDKEFKYLGRADNTINSGGVKIQLEKIETAIDNATEQSFSFFAFPIKDDVLGEALSIAFIPSQGSTKVFNKAFMKEVFPKFEVPRYYFPIERFELTASGKIDKIKTVDVHIRDQFSD